MQEKKSTGFLIETTRGCSSSEAHIETPNIKTYKWMVQTTFTSIYGKGDDVHVFEIITSTVNNEGGVVVT